MMNNMEKSPEQILKEKYESIDTWMAHDEGGLLKQIEEGFGYASAAAATQSYEAQKWAWYMLADLWAEMWSITRTEEDWQTYRLIQDFLEEYGFVEKTELTPELQAILDEHDRKRRERFGD